VGSQGLLGLVEDEDGMVLVVEEAEGLVRVVCPNAPPEINESVTASTARIFTRLSRTSAGRFRASLAVGAE